MNKLIAAIMSLVLLGAMTLPASAQGRNLVYANQGYARRYDDSRNRANNQQWRATQSNQQRAYAGRSYYNYDNRSFWQKHRDKLTVAGGTLGGAILGSLIGGRKGAVIGALAGGGGSALYSYKLRNRNRRY
jgi:hypothetical protein